MKNFNIQIWRLNFKNSGKQSDLFFNYVRGEIKKLTIWSSIHAKYCGFHRLKKAQSDFNISKVPQGVNTRFLELLRKIPRRNSRKLGKIETVHGCNFPIYKSEISAKTLTQFLGGLSVRILSRVLTERTYAAGLRTRIFRRILTLS